jgi:beta-phosphoglucomutase family hydrolase
MTPPGGDAFDVGAVVDATAGWGALFDWDGVIVDSSRLHEQAWNAVAREHGYPHGPADFKRHFGSKNERAIVEILAWTDDEGEVGTISARKEVLYREALAGAGDVVLPGSRPFLQALAAAGIPRAIVSSSPRSNIDMVLQRSALGSLFDAVISAEDVRRGKPDPEGYLLGAARLGVNPDRCVVFEDAPAGLEAGRRAGARTVGLSTTHPGATLQADLVLAELDARHLPAIGALLR